MATLVFCGGLSAQEPYERVMGTVKALPAGQLQVEATDGTVVTFQLEPRTRYVKDAAAASAADLEVGARVVVVAKKVGEQLVANEVQIGVREPAGAHAGHTAEKPAAASAPKAADKPAAHAGHEPAPRTQPEAAHGAHQPGQPSPMPAPPGAQHEGHQAGVPPAGQAQHGMGAAGADRNLFQSDMTLMAGMTADDPMGGMKMPKWDVMAMGMARASVNHQGGPSGDDAFESINWNMVMAQRDLGRGRLTLMMMNSLEPATLRNGGSPQLFQTGESFEGRPLVDRQHPHDFFMNLSVTYRLGFGSDAAAWLQVAPRGEPALGPTAFMHRASAGENPTATLGHHWQDSTHITDEVVTLGAGWRWLSAEVSAFHGREPDEGRWDLDPGELDSVSGRLKLDLTGGWSGQASYGFLNEPEPLEPGDLRRATVSIHYGAKGDRPLAATILWGRNDEEHGISDSFLVEAAYQLTRNDHVYARAESVEKDLELLETKRAPAAEADEEESTVVHAVTLGYLRDFDLFKKKDWKTGLGADLTVYGFPSELEGVYGEFPLSVRVFGRLRWGKPHGGGHGAQH